MSYQCEKCQVKIPKKVYDYSKKNYSKVLCRNCQERFKPLEKEIKMLRVL